MNVKSKKLPGHCVPVPFALVTDSGWLVVTSDKQHFQLNRRGLSNSRFPPYTRSDHHSPVAGNPRCRVVESIIGQVKHVLAGSRSKPGDVRQAVFCAHGFQRLGYRSRRLLRAIVHLTLVAAFFSAWLFARCAPGCEPLFSLPRSSRSSMPPRCSLQQLQLRLGSRAELCGADLPIVARRSGTRDA